MCTYIHEFIFIFYYNFLYVSYGGAPFREFLPVERKFSAAEDFPCSSSGVKLEEERKGLEKGILLIFRKGRIGNRNNC
jgi:hypothetical protein